MERHQLAAATMQCQPRVYQAQEAGGYSGSPCSYVLLCSLSWPLLSPVEGWRCKQGTVGMPQDKEAGVLRESVCWLQGAEEVALLGCCAPQGCSEGAEHPSCGATVERSGYSRYRGPG